MHDDTDDTEVLPSDGEGSSQADLPTVKSQEGETARPEDPKPTDATLDARASQQVTIDSDELLSDVELASQQTVGAPSFRPPVDSLSKPRGLTLEPGQTIDDFEVVEVLGRGAFGVVYLARQKSLDRMVALKVTANRGSEGRTMARLEHDHIVQVFSEIVDDSGQARLLCMQLVPGASLESIIVALRKVALHSGTWQGADYLAAIDERAQGDAAFDPSALRDRELLDEADAVESSAWVGARLAEAINFAHAHGVLHRDIKPANVLVNQYGRPMLADFNISFRSATEEESEDETFGGTLAFMAPEHLDAFDPAGKATPADVDEQSDLYSLGIVVYELLMGSRPFDDPKRVGSRTQHIRKMAVSRRESPAPVELGPPTPRKTLQHTLAKSLSGEKKDRFISGEQFGIALDGCRSLSAAVRAMPQEIWFTRLVARNPLLWAILLTFVPHLVGSAVNIPYNKNQITYEWTDSQINQFRNVIIGYNAPVYSVALATLFYFFYPVFNTWNGLHSAERQDPEKVAATRRAMLRLPIIVLIASAIGWLPGGVLFPIVLSGLGVPITLNDFLHFLLSFALSGLIAVTYSFCGMQYVVLRVLYPKFWTDASHFDSTAREELAGTPTRLWWIEKLAITIPLLASMIILLADEGTGLLPIKFLVIVLSIGGWLGFITCSSATEVMRRTYVALTGKR